MNQYNLEEGWIILNGCEFNPMGRSEEELEFFEENKFSVTFKNLLNPTSDDTTEMKI